MSDEQPKVYFGSSYEIRPGLLPDGTPTWHLWRSTPNFIVPDVHIIATNSDRTILERAIEHLKQPATPARK